MAALVRGAANILRAEEASKLIRGTQPRVWESVYAPFLFCIRQCGRSLEAWHPNNVFFFDPRAECLSYDWFFLISFFDPRNDSAIECFTASRKSNRTGRILILSNRLRVTTGFYITSKTKPAILPLTLGVKLSGAYSGPRIVRMELARPNAFQNPFLAGGVLGHGVVDCE